MSRRHELRELAHARGLEIERAGDEPRLAGAVDGEPVVIVTEQAALPGGLRPITRVLIGDGARGAHVPVEHLSPALRDELAAIALVAGGTLSHVQVHASGRAVAVTWLVPLPVAALSRALDAALALRDR